MSATCQFPNGRAAAKAYAAKHGIAGRKGGWLYHEDGRTVCQGWASYVALLARRGIIRDLDGYALSVFSNTKNNGRPVRNVFDGQPVILVANASFAEKSS